MPGMDRCQRDVSLKTLSGGLESAAGGISNQEGT